MSVRKRASAYVSFEVFKVRAKTYATQGMDRKLPESIILMFAFGKDGREQRRVVSRGELEPKGYGAGILRNLLSEGQHVGLLTQERRSSGGHWVLAVVPRDEHLRVKTYSCDIDQPGLVEGDLGASIPHARWMSQGFVSHLGRLADAARSVTVSQPGNAQPALSR